MNLEFENLTTIPKILELIISLKETVEKGTIEKRWLNTKELSDYTGYEYETMRSKIKKGEFILGVHYYKRGGKLMFDKCEVDNWVMGRQSVNNTLYEKDITNEIINDVMSLRIS